MTRSCPKHFFFRTFQTFVKNLSNNYERKRLGAYSERPEFLLLLLSLYWFKSIPKPRMYLDHEGKRIGDISPSWGITSPFASFFSSSTLVSYIIINYFSSRRTSCCLEAKVKLILILVSIANDTVCGGQWSFLGDLTSHTIQLLSFMTRMQKSAWPMFENIREKKLSRPLGTLLRPWNLDTTWLDSMESKDLNK